MPTDSGDKKPIVPFNHHVRVESLEAPLGKGKTRIPDVVELTNHFGTVHGSALFTVGEVAAGSAITRLLASDLADLRAITQSASIKYLKTPRGAIEAEATVELDRTTILNAISSGNPISVPIQVRLKDVHGVLVATMSVSWFVALRKAANVKVT